MNIYICGNHNTHGEVLIGIGTCVEIAASGCMACKLEAAKQALFEAVIKLSLYRAQHSGEYVGGIEYTQLQKMIDEVLK